MTLTTLCAIGIFFWCWVGYRLGSPDLPGIEGPHLCCVEFVSIILTVVTVALAVLGVVGLVAQWEDGEIKDQSIEAANATAVSHESEFLTTKTGRDIIECAVHAAADSYLRATQFSTAYARVSWLCYLLEYVCNLLAVQCPACVVAAKTEADC